jgi:hypothetical protein
VTLTRLSGSFVFSSTQRMLTSRPAPLTASRPLHARTPGKALQKARGILQENALQAPRTAKTLRVQLQTPLKGNSYYKTASLSN